MTHQQRARVALVTGVGRRQGIGAAICRELANQGWTICYSWWEAADRANPWGNDEGFGYRFSGELQAEGFDAFGFEADLADPKEPARLIRECNRAMGEISVLVNNAAVSETGGVDELTADSLDRHYAVNLRGMALLTQSFVRQFSRGAGGRVINLTSGQSLGPMPTELAYVASKGAVEALTLSLGPELIARGITINAVNPGPTDNGWLSDDLRRELLRSAPAGRLSAPEDIARLVAFLASPEAGWITGQIIHSEGGFQRG